MPHHFCIFNFTWLTNLNILDLNKYAEHQLKVQIEVFCSNQFFFPGGLCLVVPSNSSSRLRFCLCSQNNHVQTQVFSKVFIIWIAFRKWICQMVKIKDVLWVVTVFVAILCLIEGTGLNPRLEKISHLFAANIPEALGNTLCGQSRHEGSVSLKLH